MSEETTILLCVRNGCVEGMSIEGDEDIIREWLADPKTEMIVRIGLEIGRDMLFKSRNALFEAIEGQLA